MGVEITGEAIVEEVAVDSATAAAIDAETGAAIANGYEYGYLAESGSGALTAGELAAGVGRALVGNGISCLSSKSITRRAR